MGMSRRGRHRRAAAVTFVALGVALCAPLSAHADEERGLTVMTQNLYLGAALDSALSAQTPEAFVAAVAQIYGTMLFTNFPVRAAALADEIAAEGPDIIGLQEVSNWSAVPTHEGANPPSFDFLAILQSELERRGLDYDVAAVSDNAHIGPVPLVAPEFGCQPPDDNPTFPNCVVSLADRDVILVNDDTPGLKVTDAMNGNFSPIAQVVITTPVGRFSFNRGWAAIDATLRGTEFRFVNTHLEVENFVPVQVAQVRELLAGPLRTHRPVIAVGDFNSGPGSTSTRPYELLIKALFFDVWWLNGRDTGRTCCQNETLTNIESELTSRIDLVLVRLALPTEAHRVGHERLERTEPPFWVSDHAGVVATVRLF